MPFVNLAIAQLVGAYSAAPFLAASGSQIAGADIGANIWYVVAILSGIVVWIGALIGSRVTRTIEKPGVATLLIAVVFALAATWLATVLIVPHVDERPIWGELFTLAPVVGAMVGYFIHRGTPVASSPES